MNHKNCDRIGLDDPIRERDEIARLINSATDPVPVSIRVSGLIDEWLGSMAANSFVSHGVLEKAESECGSDEELSHVLHLEALILHHSGETYHAIDKARQCLALTSRIGHRLLEADVLIHMGQMYEALGHKDLGSEYTRAAEHARALALASHGPCGSPV